MSENLKAELRDHILGLTIDAASKTPSFAVSATNKLHTAMRCAEVPDPDHEARGHLLGASNVSRRPPSAETSPVPTSLSLSPIRGPSIGTRNKPVSRTPRESRCGIGLAADGNGPGVRAPDPSDPGQTRKVAWLA